MSIDMTQWQAIAQENIHNRPAATGRLAGKITIVTGAAQGFGKGIAEELYKEGATIIVADMNLPLAQQVAAEMGDRACAMAVNVSDEESVANMVAQTVEKFGGFDGYSVDVKETAEITVKYEGYLKQGLEIIERAKRLEDKRLPEDINYDEISGLRLEAREKLNKIRPLNLGQAGRISGVNPADVSVLMVYLATINEK